MRKTTTGGSGCTDKHFTLGKLHKNSGSKIPKQERGAGSKPRDTVHKGLCAVYPGEKMEVDSTGESERPRAHRPFSKRKSKPWPPWR